MKNTVIILLLSCVTIFCSNAASSTTTTTSVVGSTAAKRTRTSPLELAPLIDLPIISIQNTSDDSIQRAKQEQQFEETIPSYLQSARLLEESLTLFKETTESALRVPHLTAKHLLKLQSRFAPLLQISYDNAKSLYATLADPTINAETKTQSILEICASEKQVNLDTISCEHARLLIEIDQLLIVRTSHDASTDALPHYNLFELLNERIAQASVTHSKIIPLICLLHETSKIQGA